MDAPCVAIYGYRHSLVGNAWTAEPFDGSGGFIPADIRCRAPLQRVSVSSLPFADNGTELLRRRTTDGLRSASDERAKMAQPGCVRNLPGFDGGSAGAQGWRFHKEFPGD